MERSFQELAREARLSDDAIRLERFASAHLEGVAALGRDPEVQRFTYVPSPWVEGFERTWLEGYDRGWEDGTRAGFAIVDAADERFLGLALLVRIDREGREAEAGYIVSPQARGRGIAARALQLLTAWAFDELSLERVELRIAADNVASVRVAERSGFVREGVLRSLHFKHGLRADVAVYSRLASDGPTGTTQAQ
jgi:RimJ/RimL family protein N-acetyltransferase